MHMIRSSSHNQRNTICIIDDSSNVSEQTRQVYLQHTDPIRFDMEYSMNIVFYQRISHCSILFLS